MHIIKVYLPMESALWTLGSNLGMSSRTSEPSYLGLMAMGNILFVSGMMLTIGLKSSLQFFMKRSNFKGTISFGVGVFFVIIGWPILGIILEAYGFVVLFSGFWPTLAVFVQKIPIIGWLFQQPFIRSEVDNGDHSSKTQTDCCTHCQSNSHLVLDEQIGIICKYGSIVLVEIRSILPSFKKPSPQRRSNSYFAQFKSSSLSDHFQDTGGEKYGFEDYNTTGTVWDLVPGTRRSMYEHQREGFEFIWKNLAGGTIIQELEKPLCSSGSGCIISHAPGTGKTRLTIVFLQSFMKLYPDSRPVIIAPKSMLLTWEEEFIKWNIKIPFHNMNSPEFSGHENPAAVCISKKISGNRNNGSFIIV